MVESKMVMRCHKCSEALDFDVKIGRRDMCPNCYAYLHCCYNCQHWDPSVHNECRERATEFIRDRAEGNFCLYFTFKEVPAEDDGPSEAQTAKEKLEQMFGSSTTAPAPSTADEAKQRLEDLFK